MERTVDLNEDTIAAISTPPGEGAIGIVRLSGPNALAIVETAFVSSSGADLRGRVRRVFHGEIRDDDRVLDEVLVHVMAAPHSYTREDVVEINAHGGAGPLNAILELVLKKGARLAEPGEFTRRAFLNGRIDLVQAEAVIDRIRAHSLAGLQAAASAASGALSRSIAELKQSLTECLGRIEAAVDFPEDDLPEFVDETLRAQLEAAREKMDRLLATADAGRLHREGAAVAIAGRPNVGKSSLFNALLRDARAIVTAQPGTTRDAIEEYVNLNGIPVRLTDTAGLRESEDEVERIGIETARAKLRAAAAVLFVVDAANGAGEEDLRLVYELKPLEIPVALVLNKIDLAPNAPEPRLDFPFAFNVRVSALTNEGLDELESALTRLFLGGAAIGANEGMLTRVHQKDSLRRAREAVGRVLEGFDDGAPELLSVDLKEGLDALGEITGETTPDDVLERIFSDFCIGK